MRNKHWVTISSRKKDTVNRKGDVTRHTSFFKKTLAQIQTAMIRTIHSSADSTSMMVHSRPSVLHQTLLSTSAETWSPYSLSLRTTFVSLRSIKTNSLFVIQMKLTFSVSHF
ncbi:hypothetical protein DER44DRAFT_766723 [Fusarium oxysporum]|nr:hypothetical protein DER44DRAFT_766723 [Fusarium oxysporum]